MRPTQHPTADRVQAHIFVAPLALRMRRARARKTKVSWARPLGDGSAVCPQVVARRRQRLPKADQTMRDAPKPNASPQSPRALGISAITPATPPPHDTTVL